jgi:RNA polymerase sigma-70 factor (ECF subfamily)
MAEKAARQRVHEKSDEQLMACVMRGERSALATLVERHHSALLGYLYRMLGGDRPLAEDLTQETFVRLLTSSSYQQARPFRPWLYAIATNLARDHFKAASTRHSSGDGDCAHANTYRVERSEPVSGTPGPEERVLAMETGAEIAEAIARLAPEYRSALLLRFYGELSLQEIALALDVPLGTVKSRLSVGCLRLRDLLAPGVQASVSTPEEHERVATRWRSKEE